jgi:PAS domain S-box-containing protein
MVTSADILKGSILIVDDLAANVTVLEQMLHEAGYSDITSTRDPFAVCELHRQHRYDLILLDLQMPGMDGFQVMEGLKGVETNGYLPVLVITAQPGHKLRALKAGARDFISKPFDLGEVLARVRNMIEVRLLHRHDIVLNGTRLDTTQRIAGIGDWEYDFAEKRLRWSEEIYQILGLKRDDTPPDSAIFYRHVHPDDLARVHREKKAAAEGSRRVDFEHRIIREDGEVRNIHQITVMALDHDGHPARESGTIQDITERKQAGEALRQSEERYRLLFEYNPSPMWVFDQETFAFLAVNAATLALYGYSREEFMHLSALDIRPPGGVELFKRRVSMASDQLRSDGRFQHRKKDGTVFPVEIHAHGLEFDGRPARLVLALDLTSSERAATALQASETRFRALSESAPLGIFQLDASGGCIYHNPVISQLTGRSLAQNLGPGWKQCVHPEDRKVMSEGWTEAVATGSTWDQEQRLLRPDGSVRWVHTLVAPAKDAGGQTTGFVGTIEDITPRRVTEEAMRHQQAELREKTAFLVAQVDSTIDGILVVDSHGKKILQNQRCLDLWGIPPEIAAQNDEQQVEFLTARTKYPRQFVEKIHYLYTHPDETTRDEVELVDGKVFDRYSAPVLGKDGRNYGRIWTFRDITARRAADAALRESEERFKFVARAVSDAIWDWNITAGTVWWNEGFFTAFGYAPGEIAPSLDSWSAHIHPDERASIVASIHAVIAATAITWGAEYRFQRKDGSFASVLDRAFILRDSTGQAIRMVGGLRDLTEQKKMEAQFLRAQRMDSIGTLAGGIAHDLNNVLAPILMSIELLKLDPNNDPGRVKMLDTIMVSCRRGADLVRQVLSFARGLDGQRVAVRLRHLIDDLGEMIGETFPRNIRIVSDIANDIWPVTGDPTQLHQVLLNLTVNARDAMPHGGTLTIAASNVTLDAQYAGTSREATVGAYVLLKVSDTGTGIPPEVRDRIFEPFFTTKGIGEGTGIGLATVFAIVKSHGGFITVDSEVGEGTTFSVHLPADLSLRNQATQHPFAPIVLPRGNGELILVVDDESSIREITQQTLEAFGYRVLLATDGAGALAIYAMRAAEISAVLTDMMMPTMDGAALIKVILRINPLARIIAASGIDSKDAVTKAGIAGVKHFLAKPFTAETLLVQMHEVLTAPGAARPSGP